MTRALFWMIPAAALAAGAAIVTARFAVFVFPVAWTGELDRLFAALALAPGQVVADVGAGDGEFAAAMASRLGRDGRVVATELTDARRRAISDRAARAGAPVEVRVATAADTGLDAASLDALYLRTVFHHVADRAAFAAALGRAVRPGGRIAVIDFPPGALWFHGADHGVSADDVREAFGTAGWTLTARVDDWGGGMYLVVFERAGHGR